MSRQRDYYYAAGKQIELVRAEDLIAVDEVSVASAQLPQEIRDEISRVGKELRNGMSLVSRKDLSERAAALIRKKCVTQPVFRQGDSVVIVLPEVRVEGSEDDKDRVKAWVNCHVKGAKVEHRRQGQIVVRPGSDCGNAALELANQLHEQVGVESAQPRMLRIVERPGPRKK